MLGSPPLVGEPAKCFLHVVEARLGPRQAGRRGLSSGLDRCDPRRLRVNAVAELRNARVLRNACVLHDGSGVGTHGPDQDHPDQDRGAGEAVRGQGMADPDVHLAPGGRERGLVLGTGEPVENNQQADDDGSEGAQQECGDEGSVNEWGHRFPSRPLRSL